MTNNSRFESVIGVQGATVPSNVCFLFIIMHRKRLTANYDRYLSLKAATQVMTNDPQFELVIGEQGATVHSTVCF